MKISPPAGLGGLAIVVPPGRRDSILERYGPVRTWQNHQDTKMDHGAMALSRRAACPWAGIQIAKARVNGFWLCFCYIYIWLLKVNMITFDIYICTGRLQQWWGCSDIHTPIHRCRFWHSFRFHPPPSLTWPKLTAQYVCILFPVSSFVSADSFSSIFILFYSIPQHTIFIDSFSFLRHRF